MVTGTRTRSTTKRARSGPTTPKERGKRASPHAPARTGAARLSGATFAPYKPLNRAGLAPILIRVIHCLGQGPQPMDSIIGMLAGAGAGGLTRPQIVKEVKALADAGLLEVREGLYLFSREGRSLWDAVGSLARHS